MIILFCVAQIGCTRIAYVKQLEQHHNILAWHINGRPSLGQGRECARAATVKITQTDPQDPRVVVTSFVSALSPRLQFSPVKVAPLSTLWTQTTLTSSPAHARSRQTVAMSVVLGSSAEYAIDLVSDDEAQAPVPGLPSDAEQSAPGRTYVTRASARRAQIARDTGDEESRVVFHSTTTLPTRTLDHRTRWRGQDGQGNTWHADEGTYLAYTHAEVSGAAIASDRLSPRLNIETASLSSTIQHQHIRTSTASRGQQHSSSRTFERLSPPVTVLPHLPNGNHSGGREVNDIATQQSITAISVNIQDRNKDIVPGTEAPSTVFRHLNLPGGQSSVVPPAWEPSPNVRSSTKISRPQRDSAFDPRHVIENTQFEGNWDNVLAETLHNRRTALLDMGKKAPLPAAMRPAAMRPALQNRRLRRKHSGPDLVELKGHKSLETWKKKLVQEFHIEKEMERLNAAVSLFDSRDIQTVVPNRYLKETLSSKKDRPRHARFPGRIEVLTEQPMIALRNAYSEHTAVVPNPSRLVFWTDGSAGDSRRKQTRGFAVTWRRATNEGTWGVWEAAGFQGTSNNKCSRYQP